MSNESTTRISGVRPDAYLKYGLSEAKRRRLAPSRHAAGAAGPSTTIPCCTRDRDLAARRAPAAPPLPTACHRRQAPGRIAASDRRPDPFTSLRSRCSAQDRDDGASRARPAATIGQVRRILKFVTSFQRDVVVQVVREVFDVEKPGVWTLDHAAQSRKSNCCGDASQARVFSSVGRHQLLARSRASASPHPRARVPEPDDRTC